MAALWEIPAVQTLTWALVKVLIILQVMLGAVSYLIYAERVENIGLAGRGVIDGQGKHFPAQPGDDKGRPYILRFSECRNVRVEGLSFGVATTVRLSPNLELEVTGRAGTGDLQGGGRGSLRFGGGLFLFHEA